uniref:Deltamethrin resistance protein prag01 domain-containing protein n=1 Tax=Timema tahoe TaxID=61484 RepID=A0A7R9FNS7_9NEOP|nr:unnamed protein product [Timema tahoe]
MLTRTIRPVIRNILALNGGSLSQVRLYHPPAHQKEPTMDELPVPQGSWKADYDAKQTGYNLQLLAGVAFFSITLGVFTNFFFIIIVNTGRFWLCGSSGTNSSSPDLSKLLPQPRVSSPFLYPPCPSAYDLWCSKWLVVLVHKALFHTRFNSLLVFPPVLLVELSSHRVRWRVGVGVAQQRLQQHR